MSFGDEIKRLREERDLSIREVAEGMGTSATYIHDVERGRRAPFRKDTLKKAFDVFSLDDEEKYILYDLAAKDSDMVAEDVADYIKDNPSVVTFIRKVMKSGLGSDWWRDAAERWQNGN